MEQPASIDRINTTQSVIKRRRRNIQIANKKMIYDTLFERYLTCRTCRQIFCQSRILIAAIPKKLCFKTTLLTTTSRSMSRLNYLTIPWEYYMANASRQDKATDAAVTNHSEYVQLQPLVNK